MYEHEIYRIKEPEPFDLNTQVGWFYSMDGQSTQHIEVTLNTFHEHITELCYFICGNKYEIDEKDKQRLLKDCKDIFDIIDLYIKVNGDVEIGNATASEIANINRTPMDLDYAVVDGRLKYVRLHDMDCEVGEYEVRYYRNYGKFTSYATNVIPPE